MKNHADAVKIVTELDASEGTQEEMEVNSHAGDIIAAIAGYDASDMMNVMGALDFISELTNENEDNPIMLKAIKMATELIEL